MTRITDKDLQDLVDRINEATHSPKEPWGIGKANVGSYHLAFAYGGVGLHRITDAGGSISNVLGYTTKRDLYGRLQAYLAGCAVV